MNSADIKEVIEAVCTAAVTIVMLLVFCTDLFDRGNSDDDDAD